MELSGIMYPKQNTSGVMRGALIMSKKSRRGAEGGETGEIPHPRVLG